MRSNIETIKFTGAFSLLFAVLIYIVTLNIEIGFFQPNWCWISNNFALTICGGAFASFIVVMLCELQKYISNKHSCVNYMFFQAIYLYTASFSIQRIVEGFIRDPSSIIPQNCLDANINEALCEISALQNTDYVLFDKNNKLVKTHQKFCGELAPKLRSETEKYGIYLKLAVNIVQCENLKNYGFSGNVTASDPTAAKTLNCIDSEVGKLLDKISEYLFVIAQSTANRYNWTEIKDGIEKNTDLRFDSFEKFIGEEKMSE